MKTTGSIPSARGPRCILRISPILLIGAVLLALVSLPSTRAADLTASRAPGAAIDGTGNTALHVAALRNDADAVDALLAQGADASAANHAGATPLHYGICSERIVAALLAHGAKADVVSTDGITPLLGAASRSDSFGVARRLIAAGANVNHRRPNLLGPRGGLNVLATAIGSGDRRTIALLLEHGAEVNPKEGNSPLSSAAFVGDLEATRLLLRLGADVNYRSAQAGSALNYALYAWHTDVAALLIEHGADLTSRSTTGHGTPPAVWSAYNDYGDLTIPKLLLARGIDINITNDEGETALSYALRRGRDTPLVRLLKDAGATAAPAPLHRAKTIPNRAVPATPEARSALVRESAQRAVALLQRSSTAFLENGSIRTRKCVSCHQQALPAVAAGLARERGLRVDEVALGHQLHATVAQRMPQAEKARQLDEPTPAADVTLGFDADGLSALRYAQDSMCEAMSHYLLGVQRLDGSWDAPVRRPPMEDGPIIGTAWSARAVQLYPPAGRKHEVDAALRRAREWLAAQSPRSPNERVFQLLGLAWANEAPARMRPFADALCQLQRSDGGWSQLPALDSDSWATGSALVALHKAGIPTSHASYRRGVDFLLRTQFADGSWWVRSRSWPFQPHFDGQFPHGKDQWISAAGTAWATIALLLTIEPTVAPERLPDAQQLIAKFVAARNEIPARQNPLPLGRTAGVAVDFAREIQPLLERSCFDCHTGKKVKGGFNLASRDSLLKGGQSGDPAIIPGHSSESHLVRYISDQVEDLEMPPLNRRSKYPALTADEITRIRAWIDGGAEWNVAP